MKFAQNCTFPLLPKYLCAIYTVSGLPKYSCVIYTVSGYPSTRVSFILCEGYPSTHVHPLYCVRVTQVLVFHLYSIMGLWLECKIVPQAQMFKHLFSSSWWGSRRCASSKKWIVSGGSGSLQSEGCGLHFQNGAGFGPSSLLPGPLRSKKSQSHASATMMSPTPSLPWWTTYILFNDEPKK